MSSDPFYYRFALNDDGEVELGHNNETTPAHAQYHSDMGAEGAYHGYAYRIKGGWRLTDWDHKPIDDPYVIAQVIRAIRDKEGSYLPHDTEWADLPEPADRWHYGLPMQPQQAEQL